MSGISYTPIEVAEILKISKYTVYELIKRGELAAYRVGRKVRVEEADLNAFKQRARGSDFDKNLAAGRTMDINHDLDRQVIICGQDAILDVLARHLEKRLPGYSCLRNHAGSINALLALYYGKANAVTAHLWDSDSGEYNLPYVRRILPGQKVVVINMVYRTQGFYVASGNPLQFNDWIDLARVDIRYVNREPGSGVRVLLDEQLSRLGIEYRGLKGYDREATSHLAVASAVARGDADVGIGVEWVARQVPGLEFIPLQKERYDMVIKKEDLEKPFGRAILGLLSSEEFREEVTGMGGYDTSRMGEVIAEI